MASPSVRRASRAGAAVLVVAALVALGWTALALLSARTDLLAARVQLDAARDGSGEDVQERLDAARAQLERADARLDAPGPALVSRLPLLGRTPTAVRRTTQAALASVRGASDVLEVVQDGPPLLAAGRVDLERLGQLSSALRRAAEQLEPDVRRLAAVETALVPSAVADPVEQAQATLLGAPDALRAGADALGALERTVGADQPRRLLVVLQNNAELRGTGGLVSVFAEVTADRGALSVEAFRDVDDVADPVAEVRAVPAPQDYRAVFGPLLADTTLWKNTNADPHVPTSSRVLAEVAQTTLGRPVDAVVWLDVPALAEVLAATGPAQLPDGTTITGEDAVDQLLSGSYEGVADEVAAQDARRARLRGAADAVVQRLLGGDVDLTALGPALARAAAARHLALWSADETAQDGWRLAGLAGEVDAGGHDLHAFTVHNLGGGDDAGNKLDYYARTSHELRVVVDDREAAVERRVTLRNTAPAADLPVYVAGAVQPGTTNNLVLLSLPPTARGVELLRGDDLLEVRLEPLDGTAVVRDVVSLPPGASTTWTLRYRLPTDGGQYALTVVPQPQAVDGELSLTLVPAPGTRLAAGPGTGVERDGDQLVLEAPLGPQREVVVDVRSRGLLGRAVDAVRRFWEEPVPSPV